MNQTTEPADGMSPDGTPDGMRPSKTQSFEETLEATTTYLEGLPTGVEIESAVENVQAWQQELHRLGRPELNEIADHLGSFIKYLTNPEPDGKAIGRSMVHLGEMTMKAANGAEPEIGTKIKVLGNWLKKSGESM
ncbi:MAG: hypothetical protein H7Z75_04775 [Ferruginibacter sp.]|nr:hypothetical protein [Cytophagales bacterium]